MSMGDHASSHEVRHTDMSDAAGEDPDLALGKFFLYWLTYSFTQAFIVSL